MTAQSPAIAYYDARAGELADQYALASADDVLKWLFEKVPAEPGFVIDVGAGIGRESAWFAQKDWKVVAVEPSAGMREEGRKLLTDDRVLWEDDRLPALAKVTQLGYAADFVLVNAVWMHVAPTDRHRALRKLAAITKPGGLIAITVRQGPSDAARGFYAANSAEIRKLARISGLEVEMEKVVPDALGREDVTWECIALRRTDDGTNALPLLRRIILDDNKTTTYKLGLLRSLVHAADTVSGLTKHHGGEYVTVPLGVVALNWLRLYLPLLHDNLPQSPINRAGGERLEFAQKGGAGDLIADFDPRLLQVGVEIKDSDTANSVREAIRQTVGTILDGPVQFTKMPEGSQVFRLDERRRPFRYKPKTSLTIDDDFLRSFGNLRVPTNVWETFMRFGHWVEPALNAEWLRLMKQYAQSQEREPINESLASRAMTWFDPTRTTAEVRAIVEEKIEHGEVKCVWTDTSLTRANFDVDHCFPWSAWPCNDLWNLMPATREVNQRLKQGRMPSLTALNGASGRIINWWQSGYLDRPENSMLPNRFRLEAHASLAALSDKRNPGPEQVFEAMTRHQLRLWQDQRVPEWDG